MKRILFGMLMISVMAFVSLNAAVVQLAEGTDVLSAAITAAADGDIIELTSDGGVYSETSNMTIDKSITIRAASGLASMPVIRSAKADYWFKLTGVNAHYVFDGIEVDGTNGTASSVGKYFLRIDSADSTGTMVVEVLNSVVHNFTDKHIKPYPLSGMDALIIDNSVFYAGASEGIVLYSGTSADPAAFIRNASFTNSTFYDFEREAIKGQTFDSTKVLVDRCTFYNLGENDKKAMIYFRNMEDVIVKNSIFAENNNADAEKFADFASDVAIFHNNVVWNTTNYTVGSATVMDTVHMDPGFANPTAGDFTLPATSPLLFFADDFGPIGDSRWIPMPTVYQVAAGTDAISTAYAAASAGDVIELISDGGIYQETSGLNIDKAISIVADPGMFAKPIVRCDAAGDYVFKLTATAGFVGLSGFEVDGTNGGSAASSKYFIRVENNDTSATVILNVNNMVAHDFTDKHIKFYPNSGAKAFMVDNSILYGGASEGITLYSGTSTDDPAYIQMASFVNTTFYNFEREAIKGQTYGKTMVMVDRCTFYNLGENDKKAMIYFRDMENVEVRNSIFAENNNIDAEKFADFATDISVFHNNVVWNTTNYDVGNATVADTLHVDPDFTDAANADFTINNTTLFTYADDGGPIGDSRWAPSQDGKVNLAVAVIGSGSVTMDPAGGSYDPGTSVTLTPTANEFWEFDRWEGVLTLPGQTVITVVVNENMALAAYFKPAIPEYAVEIDSLGLGHVDVQHFSDYVGLDGVFQGDSLVFTAVADTNTWEFAYWMDALGDSVDNVNPLEWIANEDLTLVGFFRSTIEQVAFTDTVIGMGKLVITPKPVAGFDTYDLGTVLTLEIFPAMGWEFTAWSGDLSGAADSVDLTLDANKSVTATLSEVSVPDGMLAIDAGWDLRDAIDFARNNSQVEVLLLTEAGPYAGTEEMRTDGKIPYLNIDFPLAIVGSDTITDGKATIKGWGEGGSEGLFRLRANANLKLDNVFIDGYFADDKITKYLFRSDDGTDIHVSVFARDSEFRGTKEVFFKNYALSNVDTLVFENCTVWDIGKEGIYDNGAGTFGFVGLSNSTFYNVGREVLRLKAADSSPMVIIDHVTVDDCGKGYGTEGDKFSAFKFEQPTAVMISNTIISNVTNSIYGYSIRLNSDASFIENSLFFNTPEPDFDNGAFMAMDVLYGDPMYLDAVARDFTLKDSSAAYHMMNDESAGIGDLRWATSAATVVYHSFELIPSGDGFVDIDPMPYAKFYVPGTVVTLTATPDSLSEFVGWGGDLSGSDLITQLTMDADKSVTADFEEPVFHVELGVNMRVQIKAGNFIAGVDTVDVKGMFHNWGEQELLCEDTDGDSIYTVTMEFAKLTTQKKSTFKFRINGIEEDRGNSKSGADREIEVTSDTTLVYFYNDEAVWLGLDGIVPEEYSLSQNYPNPFNPMTTIEFTLKETQKTKLIVFDILGREIATLVDKELTPGFYSVNLNGSQFSSGVYFYKLTSGDFTKIKKMLLVK